MSERQRCSIVCNKDGEVIFTLWHGEHQVTLELNPEVTLRVIWAWVRETLLSGLRPISRDHAILLATIRQALVSPTLQALAHDHCPNTWIELVDELAKAHSER